MSSGCELKAVGQLGEGSYGKVYKVMNKRGELFALKVSKTKEAVSYVELNVGSTLRYAPNLLTFLGITKSCGLPFIGTISEIVSPMSMLQANPMIYKHELLNNILPQLACGLEVLHRNDILHMDIKPDNVLFKRTGSGYTYMLADFGLAIYTDNAYLTECCIKRGTPLYMHPKLSINGKYDYGVDMWSLAMTMLSLLHPPTGEKYEDASEYIKTVFEKKWQEMGKGDAANKAVAIEIYRLALFDITNFVRFQLSKSPIFDNQDELEGMCKMIVPMMRIEPAPITAAQLIKTCPSFNLNEPVVDANKDNELLKSYLNTFNSIISRVSNIPIELYFAALDLFMRAVQVIDVDIEKLSALSLLISSYFILPGNVVDKSVSPLGPLYDADIDDQLVLALDGFLYRPNIWDRARSVEESVEIWIYMMQNPNQYLKHTWRSAEKISKPKQTFEQWFIKANGGV